MQTPPPGWSDSATREGELRLNLADGPGQDFSVVDAAISAADEQDLAFQRWYGPWEHLTPTQAAQILAGFDHPWWVCGGYAIEAFTGAPRRHKDVDIGFFARDLLALRAFMSPRYHLWSVGSGMLRPLDEEFPELHSESSQVWIRQHAWSPWLLDMLATSDDNGRWVNKRDPSYTAPLDEVTWVDEQGVRFLDADLVLAIKAKHNREADRWDFTAALPLLDAAGRARLAGYLAAHDPEHPWLRSLVE
jgi:hypothetical protein